jgi:hypothetical protein
MTFVAGGIAFNFVDPEGAPVHGRGAVPAAAMPMPETAMDENRRFVSGQNDVGNGEAKGVFR